MSDTHRRLMHSEPITVRWGDMDALGHVNNTVFFRYAEQARVSWLDGLLGTKGLDVSSQGPILAKTSCTFLRPIVYPASIKVELYAGTPGRSSLPTHYRIVDAADAACCYAEGDALIVWADYASGKSTPLPQTLRDAVAA